MNILQVNNTDLPGARFNGYNLQREFNRRGIRTRQIVYEKLSNDNNVISFADSIDTQKIYRQFEKELSLQSMIFPYAKKIMRMQEFKKADVVHYHLIHNFIMSLVDFPQLIDKKPSVWTIHDPWIFTGHCIYPINCDKYKWGCGSCEFLSRHFSMDLDNTASLWQMKKDILSQLEIDVVVASKWMYDLLKASPIAQHFEKVHIIPFGIDLTKFQHLQEDKDGMKRKSGVAEDSFVIFFRADRSEYKGLKYIKKMLRSLNCSRKITLLTVGEAGLLDEFKGKYNVKDHGWVHDEKKLAELYISADLFLMPSTAEAFGVMAIEAMAAALPIIVFDGTALPAVVHAPECGIALEPDDAENFVQTVKRLIENPAECRIRGNLARKIAEKEYDEEIYFKRLLNLYQDIYRRI